LLFVVVLAIGLAHLPSASGPRIGGRGVGELPLVAQGVVSAALGADSPAYRVLGLRANNPAQRLRLRFSRDGVEVASAGTSVSLGLAAYGRGSQLRAPRPASVSVRANRVSYAYGPFSEWFANGPRGLEQGFDVEARPPGVPGALTFALRLSGGGMHVRLRRGELLLAGDGSSLLYGGLTATDADGKVLPSWLQLAGGRLMVRVDDRGARYPLQIDPFLQQGELSDRPGASGEEFGESVAVAGRTLVVGTINHIATSTRFEQGAAYVFTAPASGWAHARQTAILKAPRGQPEEEFGRSVAISGNTIVVGAPFREVANHTNQGVAYVFDKPASGWKGAGATATLTARAGRAHEYFGESVAISGNTVFVGAPGRKVGKHTAQGAVYAFSVSRSPRAATARQLLELTAPDGQAEDALGISVAVSGGTLLAGADLHRVGETANEGVVEVFSKRARGWSSARETAQLSNEHGERGELFGRVLAIWENTVVVGSPDRRGANAEQGAAYVFVKPAHGWAGSLTQTAELTASDPGQSDQFGGALAVSGGQIVVGAPGHTIAKNTEQGAGYVFVEPANGWRTTTETSELTAAGGAAGDRLGLSVALSGDTILIAAPGRAENGELGHGALYEFRDAS
jgi:trimeric autotransporter adhesin